MLELIVMERVERGELRLDEPIRASAWASKMGGSQVGYSIFTTETVIPELTSKL